MARHKLGTRWHHFWREGELLAVENEHGALLVDVMVVLPALFLDRGPEVDDLENFLLDESHVFVLRT